jgi:cyclohexyl-isocyanide hydratase
MADTPFIIVEALYPCLTQLDFTAPHTILSRIPGAKTIVASEPGGEIESDGSLVFAHTKRLADIERCDLLFAPGGMAASDVINDLAFMAEFKRLAADAKYLTSVCTGSIVLGAAGLLKGVSARPAIGPGSTCCRCSAQSPTRAASRATATSSLAGA